MTISPHADTGDRISPLAYDGETIDGLLRRARCVLLDFDGPLCRVFAGQPADGVAAALVGWLRGEGIDLYPGEQPRDPMEVFRDAGQKLPVDTVTALEAILTEHEISAVRTSRPTRGADQVVKALDATGRRLAVASNNAAEAIESYLGRNGMTGYFHGMVQGRSTDPALMKPDPDCVIRALLSAGADASTALMVGDSASDFEAASRAGVPFLGFAVDQRHDDALRSAGATTIVPSWDPVIAAVTEAGM